jgi:hypothetical protein
LNMDSTEDDEKDDITTVSSPSRTNWTDLNQRIRRIKSEGDTESLSSPRKGESPRWGRPLREENPRWSNPLNRETRLYEKLPYGVHYDPDDEECRNVVLGTVMFYESR